MARWTPLIGQEAARYKWWTGCAFVGQGPLMVLWFGAFFLGAQLHVEALTIVGVFLVVGAVALWLAMQKLDGLTGSAAGFREAANQRAALAAKQRDEQT